MSAHCDECGHDMGYGPDMVPVCGYCELRNERERLQKERDSAVAWANTIHETVLEAVDDHSPALGQSVHDFIRHRINTTATQYEYAALRQMLERARELDSLEGTAFGVALDLRELADKEGARGFPKLTSFLHERADKLARAAAKRDRKDTARSVRASEARTTSPGVTND